MNAPNDNDNQQNPDFTGFDPEFKDFTDYIVRITHRIWEERNVDAIRRYYGESMALHSSAGTIVGAEAVVFNTFQMLNAFPDRRLLPADVIWCKEPDGTYYSSHRLLSVMTHLGAGIYGPPTGRRVVMQTVADCAVKDGVIFEEWLVRDQAGIMLQLGLPVDRKAEELAKEDKAQERQEAFISMAEKVEGRAMPEKRGDYSHKYAEGVRSIWSQGSLGLIPELYHEACVVEGPSNARIYGHEMLHRFFFRYLGALKDIRFDVDHIIEQKEAEKPVRIAMRWRLSGIHAGSGPMGEPSGQPIFIMGINHAHMTGGKVVAEWMMIDDLTIQRQVALNRPPMFSESDNLNQPIKVTS